MEKYIKIKQGTKAWDLFNEHWTFPNRWSANKEVIENFLGFPMQDNLFYNIDTLTIERKVLPLEWESQFKKNSYPAVAKATSAVNKTWLKMCKELGLEVVTHSSVLMKLNVFGSVSVLYPLINGDYYLKTKSENSRAWDKVDDWSTIEWAEEIKGSEFLKLHEDWLEKKEKAKVSV